MTGRRDNRPRPIRPPHSSRQTADSPTTGPSTARGLHGFTLVFMRFFLKPKPQGGKKNKHQLYRQDAWFRIKTKPRRTQKKGKKKTIKQPKRASCMCMSMSEPHGLSLNTTNMRKGEGGGPITGMQTYGQSRRPTEKAKKNFFSRTGNAGLDFQKYCLYKSTVCLLPRPRPCADDFFRFTKIHNRLKLTMIVCESVDVLQRAPCIICFVFSYLECVAYFH